MLGLGVLGFAAVTARANDDALEAQVRSLIAGLAPDVEAAAGRRFDHLPKIVFTDPETETPRLVEQFARTMSQERAFDTATVLVSAAFAAYLPDGDEIVVFAEHLDTVPNDADGALRADVLRCTLAHEMVHALQAQQVPEVMGAFDDDTLMQRIAIEGQASVLGDRACGRPAGIGYLRWASGAWVRPTECGEGQVCRGPVGLWGPGELLYGWGSRWMEREIALGGVESTWALLSDPPDLDTFDDEVAEDLESEFSLPAWPSQDQADRACEKLGGRADPLERRFGGPTHRNDPNYPWWPGSYQDWELVAYLRTVTWWRCSTGIEVVAIDALGAGPMLAERAVTADRVRKRHNVVWIEDLGLHRWEASGSAHHVVIYPNQRRLRPAAVRAGLRTLGWHLSGETGHGDW
jgi:hypothetical protein